MGCNRLCAFWTRSVDSRYFYCRGLQPYCLSANLPTSILLESRMGTPEDRRGSHPQSRYQPSTQPTQNATYLCLVEGSLEVSRLPGDGFRSSSLRFPLSWTHIPCGFFQI